MYLAYRLIRKKTSWFSIATVQLAGAAYPEAPEVLQGGAPVSDSSLNLYVYTSNFTMVYGRYIYGNYIYHKP